MPRKPCSTNCASVPAWWATRSDLIPNGSIGNSVNWSHWIGRRSPLIVSASRIAPNVRGTKVKTGWPVACHFEIATSESEGKRDRPAARTRRLTRREQQIVDLLLEGCGNIEIARQLRIAQRTVKACFNRLFLRFGITSGIKRVKLATLLYRNKLCSDVILTGSDAQRKGNTASSLSSPRGSITGTSLEKFEPRGPSSRTVFESSMTSWESGTVASLPGGAPRASARRRAGAVHFPS